MSYLSLRERVEREREREREKGHQLIIQQKALQYMTHRQMSHDRKSIGSETSL